VAGADWVSVAGFAEHLVARVFIDSVITGQQDAPLRHEVINHPTGQGMSQPPTGPASLGGDAVIGGRMAWSQGTKCA
jgi:hypothetical protein